MNCPSCKAAMTTMTFDAHLSAPVDIDMCSNCQAFWFDKYESLKLAPASTLKLIKLIGEGSAATKPPLSSNLMCPRCHASLLLTHDMQRSTRFNYWRCGNNHGRFIGFFDFLREKNFIRPLPPDEIEELRKKIQTVNCSNCGAPIDLMSATSCTHCGTPLSVLDMEQPKQLLEQLKQASEPRPIDPALPFELARVKREVERMFGPQDLDNDRWSEVSARGLIESGLSAMTQWLKKAGF